MISSQDGPLEDLIRLKNQLDEAEQSITQSVRLGQNQKGSSSPTSYDPSEQRERSCPHPGNFSIKEAEQKSLKSLAKVEESILRRIFSHRFKLPNPLSKILAFFMPTPLTL